MEKNKQIKVSLKTAIIIIICIIAILIIGIVIVIKSGEGNYIYNEDIKSITIKYYEGYNFGTGDAIRDTIPLNTINLKSDDLNELSKLIKVLTKVKYSKYDERYRHIPYDYLLDNYKLEINGNFIIYIGDQYGIVAEKNDYFKVPEELYNKILKITQNYNEQNLYKKINSTKITIISEQEKFEVTDEEQLNQLSNYQYYVINASDKDFENLGKIAYTLDLNDGRKIDTYLGVLSCIYYENGTHEYIYTGNLENYVEKIIGNSKVKLNTNTVTSIIVTYKNKEYIIDNKDKILEILKELKNLKYDDYDYLKSMSEADFDENDIKIFVNNSKYIIFENQCFYIDEDGKWYFVSELYNLEKYFKDLVNYDV